MVKFILPSFLSSAVAGAAIRAKIEFRSVDESLRLKIRIKIGRNIQPISLGLATGTVAHRFRSFEFKTGSGFKLVQLQALGPTGGWHTASACVIWARARRHPNFRISPALSLIANAPAPKPETIKLPEHNEPLVSIIIPIYNQTAYTLKCLDSISRHTTGAAYEVIVVDDCSPEPDVAQLSRIGSLRVHRNTKNLGFVLSCNQGARIARGTHLIFLNNDTLVSAGWLKALLDTFDQRPDAGLVGAKLIYPDNTLQEAGAIIWRDGTGHNYGRNQSPDSPEFNYLKEVDYCSGACVLIQRERFLKLGGFDERYIPAYYEDTDLAFRIREAGLKVYYQPKCEIIHFEGKSNGVDTNGTGVKRYQTINRAKFLDRWRDTLETTQASSPRYVFHARDRSTRRPTLLLVDHYVPRPDQDAGSRCIVHLIDFFLSHGFNVKFFPDNLVYDSTYTPALENRGVEVLDERFGAGFTLATWLQNHGHRLDYAMLSRAHIACNHLDDLEYFSPARRFLYGHDLLSRTLKRSYALTGNQSFDAQAHQWYKWEQTVFPRVHAVYYPSTEEIVALRKTNPELRARLVPLLTFPPSPCLAPQASDFEGKNSILFVGGFGHPPNIDAIRWFLADVWPTITARLPEALLEIVGSNPPDDLLHLSTLGIRFHGFVPDKELTHLYSRARIAIAPLRQGGGIKGKILEALQRDVPVITTAIGAEGIPNASTAMTIAEPKNFADQLTTLYSSPERLAAQAQAGRHLLADHFSTQTLINALVEDIPHLANKRTS